MIMLSQLKQSKISKESGTVSGGKGLGPSTARDVEALRSSIKIDTPLLEMAQRNSGIYFRMTLTSQPWVR